MRYLIIAIIILLLSCKDSSNNLYSTYQTIEVIHIPWSCDSSKLYLPPLSSQYNDYDCAKWNFPEDVKKYADISQDTLKSLCIFIEPIDSSLVLPDSIEFFNDGVRLTGQFYIKKGYVAKHNPLKLVDSARVFRYSKFTILRGKYKDPSD